MIVGLTVLRQLLRFSAISVFKFIPTKIHKTVATRAAPFGPDMHQIVCRLGFAPDPTGGAYSAPPDPLAGLRGPTSKGRGGKGKEREGRGPTSKGRGREGREGRRWEGKGGKRRGKGKGEREGRKGIAGPIPNPSARLSVCHVVILTFKRCRPIHIDRLLSLHDRDIVLVS